MSIPSREASSKSTLAAELLTSFDKSHSLDAAACSVIECIASRSSSIVFSYDVAEHSGFGTWTKEWARTDPKAVRFVPLQTRTGAGLTLVGRLSEGTSKDVQNGLALTAYTTPGGLAQMSSALALLPKPSIAGRLVIQLAGLTPVTPDLIFSPTLAPAFSALFSLPASFAVILSSTPQEAVELASLAYRLPHNHVVHVFDHHSSARETTHLVLPSQTSSPGMSLHNAFADIGYGFFDYAGDNEAHTVVVFLNGPVATAAKSLVSQITGLGILVVRVLRPWDEGMFRMALPSTVRAVNVMDDVPSELTQGGLFMDVFSSLFDPSSLSSPTVHTHRNTPQRIQQYLSSPNQFTSFLLSLLPPSSQYPLAGPNLAVAQASKKLLFFSAASTNLSGLPLLVKNAFLSHRSIKTRHLREHDAFSRSGGVTVDRVVLSAKLDLDDHIPMPFLLPLDTSVSEDTEGIADFVGVLDQTLLKSHSILKYARRGRPVLISTNWSTDEFLANIPPKTLALIRERELRIYMLDTKGLATELLASKDSSAIGRVEQLMGYLAFMRLYMSKGDMAGKGILEQLARSSFSSSVEGIDLGIICTKAWDALECVAMPANGTRADNLNDPDVKVVPLKEFEFNTVEQDDTVYHPGSDTPIVSAWHDAAKHIIFREALAPPTEEEGSLQVPALRPDLAELTFLVTTTVNRRLTPKDYDRNVFHLEFDTSGTGLKYAIGEALGVHGWNDTGDVLEFCEWYGVDPEQLITIPAPGRGNGKEKLRHTRTVFQALQQQIDIFGRPPKSFYAALSKYAQLRSDQMALHFISSAEGSSSFKKLAEKDTVTFAEVLKAYKSAKPSLAELCELVGDISPRHYSIASSQAAVGDRVDLLVVTVDWMTPSGERGFVISSCLS